MSNNIDWIEIDSIEDALAWFKNNSGTRINYRDCVTGNEKFANCGFTETYYTQSSKRGDFPEVLEQDSSPKAWSHYLHQYTYLTFGKAGCGHNYSFERLKYGGNRIFAVVQPDSILNGKTIKNCKYKEHLGGETDFNFSNDEEKNNPTYQKLKKILEYDSYPNEKRKKALQLLDCCHTRHHSLLNFSLMESSCGLQKIKGFYDGGNDRPDCLIRRLSEYYKLKNKKSTALTNDLEAMDILENYLSAFENVNNYCAKIYFLPTSNNPTDMMNHCAIDTNEERWKSLLSDNYKLIEDLIESGSKFIDTPDRVVDYMILAVRFWQAKERYFELMDPIIDSNAIK